MDGARTRHLEFRGHGPGKAEDPSLFPTSRGAVEDRSHYSHYQVYDVAPDGGVELVERSGREEEEFSKAKEIWHSIKVRFEALG